LAACSDGLRPFSVISFQFSAAEYVGLLSVVAQCGSPALRLAMSCDWYAKMTKRRKIVVALLAFSALAVILTTLGCASMQKWLDRSGLEDYAAEFETKPIVADHPTSPKSLEDLDARTSPAQVEIKVGGIPPFEVDGAEFSEAWRFASAISDNPAVATATSFVFRHGKIGEHPVVLWLPGNRFGPLAYPLVGHFYDKIYDAGYDLLVWVPPFHVNRVDALDSGILGVNTSQNIHVLLESVREIRTVMAELRRNGVKRIGGWGGSMGAAILWLVSAVEPMDHMSLMIPVLDWRTITLDPPEMAGLTRKIEASGITRQELSEAYRWISPISYPTKTKPDRIQIQLGEYDQLNPEEFVRQFAQDRGIDDVTGYDRSHATILLTPSLYEDYRLFLKRIAPRK